MRLALTLAERSSGSSVRLPIGVTVVVGGHGRPPEARGALVSSGTCWQAWTAHLPRLPASCSSGPRPPWATGVSGRPDDGRSGMAVGLDSVAGMPATTVAQPRAGRRSWVTQGLNQGFLARDVGTP